MRIVLLGTGVRPIPPEGYGGVERTIADLARALDQIGVPVEVVNEVHPGRLGEYRFANHLAARRSELVGSLLHASTPVVATRLKRLDLPFLYTTHSRHWFLVSGPTERWGLRLERRSVRAARTVIALTSAVRDRILGSFPEGERPQRVETIGLGVDHSRFSPRSASGDPRLVLGVGAILPLKRWEWAARALEGTGTRLRLVGPVLDEGYARHLRRFRSVEVAGEASEEALPDEFERAGMLVHPSAAELFPGVVAQAMASGRPVVGFSPVAPLVGNEDAGVVIDLTSLSEEAAVRALRAATRRLQDDDALRVRMGRAGRAKAVREFDWEKVARAHRDLYARIGAEMTPGP